MQLLPPTPDHIVALLIPGPVPILAYAPAAAYRLTSACLSFPSFKPQDLILYELTVVTCVACSLVLGASAAKFSSPLT